MNFLEMDEITAEKQILCSIFSRVKERYGKRTDELVDRIDYEIEYFKGQGQLKYVLFIADVFEYARKNDIEVCARDAMNSSVLLYLYGVTEIDPIHFQLPFKFPVVFGKTKVDYPNFGFDVEKGFAQTIKDYINEKIPQGDNFKIDILSMESLRFYRKLRQRIKLKYNKDIQFDCHSCTDEKTLQLFKSGDTDGVFQFDIEIIKEGLKTLPDVSFDNLVKIVALNRPSYCYRIREIVSGEMKLYLFREDMFEYLYSIGFSKEQVNAFRIAFINRDTEKLDALMEEYISKTAKDTTERISTIKKWQSLCEKYSKAFSKSHAVAIAFIAYRLAYFKAHYREDFEEIISE